MFFVHYKDGSFWNLAKFDTEGEAKGFIDELANEGRIEFYLSKEIPINIKVKVEF